MGTDVHAWRVPHLRVLERRVVAIPRERSRLSGHAAGWRLCGSIIFARCCTLRWLESSPRMGCKPVRWGTSNLEKDRTSGQMGRLKSCMLDGGTRSDIQVVFSCLKGKVRK